MLTLSRPQESQQRNANIKIAEVVITLGEERLQCEKTVSGQSPTGTVNSKWWYWVALQPPAVLGLILVWTVTIAVAGVPTGSVLGGGTSPLMVIAGLYTYVVIAIHFIVLFAYFADTKAITNADDCEWNPSGAAYAGLGLLFGSFVALWYLRNRRHYLNTP